MAEVKMKVDGLGVRGTSTTIVDLPSNSKTDKLKNEKKVEKVITGKVVERKKSLGKRFAEAFIGEDVKSVKSHILYDVLIPAAKSTISDMVSSGIEMLLFGSTSRSNRTRRDGNRSYVSYSSISRNDRNSYDNRKEREERNRARHNFDDIVLETRGEAEEVLSHLVDLTIDYDLASVADLYDLVGITSNFTDNKYGWVDLSSASVKRVRDGYLLDLPKPVLLD